jgi:hypothetical protein
MWWQYPVQIWLYRVSNHCLLVHGIKWDTYYWRCKTNNHWSPIKAHFQDAVGCVLVSLFGIQAANTFFTTGCNQSPPRVHKIYDPLSLTLGWGSCSGCGRVRVSVRFDHERGEYIESHPGCTHLNIVQLSVVYLITTRNGRYEMQNRRLEWMG